RIAPEWASILHLRETDRRFGKLPGLYIFPALFLLRPFRDDTLVKMTASELCLLTSHLSKLAEDVRQSYLPTSVRLRLHPLVDQLCDEHLDVGRRLCRD